ncbi:unnamed protein product [Soboliphyme baturini]|uniref:ESF1 domain-containing protein n=1 Tax=Soboliphyme baturini TaxID=241478 RepID=A0A183IZS5_9BILA|nr:unnamed protein product [Soboliphyme baturini]
MGGGGGENCMLKLRFEDRTLGLMQVRAWSFKGFNNQNKPFVRHSDFYVAMQRHTSCGCGQCAKKVACTEMQERVGCECRCRNAAQCTGFNQKWSNDSCQCVCANKTCAEGHTLNQASCRFSFRLIYVAVCLFYTRFLT